MSKSRQIDLDCDAGPAGRRQQSAKMPSRKPRLDQERSRWRDLRHQWRQIARLAARELTVSRRLCVGDWS